MLFRDLTENPDSVLLLELELTSSCSSLEVVVPSDVLELESSSWSGLMSPPWLVLRAFLFKIAIAGDVGMRTPLWGGEPMR